MNTELVWLLAADKHARFHRDARRWGLGARSRADRAPIEDYPSLSARRFTDS